MAKKLAGTLTTLALAGALAFDFGGCAKRNLNSEYINLPGGYKTIASAYNILEILAGIHAGTIQLGLEREKGVFTGGIITKGDYDLQKNPESMLDVANFADKYSGDKIITYREALELQTSFYSKVFEKYMVKEK